MADITDHISGLSENEVATRKARGEVNAPPPAPGRTYRQIFIENVFSFINNVFYTLCLLLVLLGRPFDAILPMAVVAANVAVSVFQEVRAKRKLDKIALLTRPTAKVIREGREQTIAPGDIGLVPQGLLLAIVVAYALGAVKVAGQGALVQQTNAIESLSNVDTFCLDKTGTLTTNRLQVHDIHPFGISLNDLRERLSGFVASATSSNKTSEAIAQALPGKKQPVLDEVPFSSARKWSALVFDGHEEGIHANPKAATDGTTPHLPSTAANSLRGVYVLGAPEMLRPHLRQGADLDGQGEEWAAHGLRVLL